jgi:hypothetical protein
MEYHLLNWEGRPLSFDTAPKIEIIRMTPDFRAGICSILYLLSISTGMSFMTISKDGECVDPEAMINGYLMTVKNVGGNVITELRHSEHKKFYSILGNINVYISFEFDKNDFLLGIKYACKLLNRNYHNILIEHNFTKPTQKIKNTVPHRAGSAGCIGPSDIYDGFRLTASH